MVPSTRHGRRMLFAGVIAVVDALVLALAIHAQVDYHHVTGTAGSTDLPIVASFIFALILSILLAVTLVEERHRWR